MTARIAITNCDNWDQDILIYQQGEPGYVRLARGHTHYINGHYPYTISLAEGPRGREYGKYLGDPTVTCTSLQPPEAKSA